MLASMAPGWVTYRPEDGAFTANFPATPHAGPVARPAGLPPGPAVQIALLQGSSGYFVGYLDDAATLEFPVEAAGGHTLGPFELSRGVTATGFTLNGGSQRGFSLKRGSRLYIVLAENVSDEDYHTFIHGFRWLSDPT